MIKRVNSADYQVYEQDLFNCRILAVTMILVYLDTNIYLDYWEKRTDNLRPLDEVAFQVLKRTVECEFEIVISDLVLAELEKYLAFDSIRAILNPLEKLKKIRLVKKSKKDLEKVSDLYSKIRIHKSDILHAVLAKKAGAVYLVTRNVGHFSKIGLIQPILPENL